MMSSNCFKCILNLGQLLVVQEQWKAENEHSKYNALQKLWGKVHLTYFNCNKFYRIVFPKIGGVEHKTKEIHVTHIIGKGQEIFAPKEMSRTSPIEDPSTFTGTAES